MSDMRFVTTIEDRNCVIQISHELHLGTVINSTASVQWSNGVIQKYENSPPENHHNTEPSFIIPSPQGGFYYLHGNCITHVVNDKMKITIVKDSAAKDDYNWFGSFEEGDVKYYPAYNVLILTFFGGDHDHIWWWCLDTPGQEAALDKPCYFNGVFNADLYLSAISHERYAIGVYFGYSDSCGSTSDDDDDENSAESSNENTHDDTLTILFDTKTLKFQEYSKTALKEQVAEKMSAEHVYTLDELHALLLSQLPQ